MFHEEKKVDIKSPDSWQSWYRLLIAFLIATVGNAGIWAIVVVMPSIESDFLLERSQTSIPYAATMCGYAIGNFTLGKLIDRYGLIKILLIAIAALSASFLLTTETNSLVSFSIIQFIIGVGTGVSFGPLMADISHCFQKYRGIAVSIVASGNYFSGVVWPLVLAGVVENGGWRDAYLTLAISSFAIGFPAALLLRKQKIKIFDPVKNKTNTFSTQKPVINNIRLTFLLGFAGVACCVAMAMPQVHIVSYCFDLGFGTAVGGQMLSVMLAGGVLSRLVFGFILDRLGGIKTVILGSTLQGLALFLFIPFDGLVSLYTVSFVFGLSQGGIVPSYAIVIRELMPKSIAGARIGFVIMCTIIGMALGGWISGWIFEKTGSYQLAFLHGILWNFLNISVMVTVFLKYRNSSTQRA